MTKYHTIMGANIDNYIIPLETVKQYLIDRGYWRQYLINYFKPHFHEVAAEFQGSQDGEAIVGYDKNDTMNFIYHLDPANIAQLNDAKVNNNLEQYLQEQLNL